MTFMAILEKLACNAGKAERVNMKKKELLGKIEELENEVVSLKARITILEASKPAIVYPDPHTTPTNPWGTWKDVPIYPPYIFYC